MAPFTRKNPAPPPEAAPVEPSTQQRYETLLAERQQLEATIAVHREERERLLHQAEVPALGAITALATQTEAVQLQIEWIDRQLPALQAAIAEEHRAAREAVWQAHQPRLADAQDRLEAAIIEFHAALHAAHEVFNAARAFGDRVSNTFVRPFPEESYNRYALTVYLRTIEQRQRPAVTPLPAIELAVLDDDSGAPWRPRFKPRKVPRDLVEQVSPLGMRRIRVLHTFNASNLSFGHTKLLADTEMMVPAPAAFAMTYAGVAEYLDEPATAPAA